MSTFKHQCHFRGGKFMLEGLFFFYSHIKTVEAPQTPASWQHLWKLQKCCYQMCLVAPDTQTWTQLEMFLQFIVKSVNWKVAVHQRRQQDDRRTCWVLSNFSVDWHQCWVTAVAWGCSLMRLLSSESWKLHGWFPAAPGVHCSQARTQIQTQYFTKILANEGWGGDWWLFPQLFLIHLCINVSPTPTHWLASGVCQVFINYCIFCYSKQKRKQPIYTRSCV